MCVLVGGVLASASPAGRSVTGPPWNPEEGEVKGEDSQEGLQSASGSPSAQPGAHTAGSRPWDGGASPLQLAQLRSASPAAGREGSTSARRAGLDVGTG